jgi:hypothetical protein
VAPRRDLPTERGARKALLRAPAEGVPLLQGADPAKADLVLHLRPVENRERVAVGDADDAVHNNPGRRAGVTSLA